MEKIFFDSGASIVRTTIITILAYVALIFFLRISGKRTLSKMNAFDFIVTIALGSTLASVLLNKNVALADGALALFLLVTLQYIITYLSVRYKGINKLVKSTPALLLHKGQMQQKAMRRERVTVDELYAVGRKHGLASLDEVYAIVLETDGTLTLLKEPPMGKQSTLTNVQIPAAAQATNKD